MAVKHGVTSSVPKPRKLNSEVSSFARYVREQLGRTTYAVLALTSGIPPHSLNLWLSSATAVPTDKKDINRLACGLALLKDGIDQRTLNRSGQTMDEGKKKAPKKLSSDGRGQVGVILRELLVLSGYGTYAGDRNRTWDRLTDEAAKPGERREMRTESSEDHPLRAAVQRYFSSRTPVGGGASFRDLIPALALNAGVRTSDIETWLAVKRAANGEYEAVSSLERRPVPGIEDANRLAVAIALLLDGITLCVDGREVANPPAAPIRTLNRSTISTLLDELLSLAGFGEEPSDLDALYARTTGAPSRVQTKSPACPEVRIGYVDSYPMCHHGDKRGPVGLASEVVRQVAFTMGLEPIWVKIEWSELERSIIDRKVDILAPMALDFPLRMLTINFTKGLPGLRSGMNCVVARSKRDDVCRPAAGGKWDWRNIDYSKLIIEYLPGNVGDGGARRFLPPGVADNVNALVDQFQAASPLKSGEQPWADVVRHPVDFRDGRIRCYLTGQLICAEAVYTKAGEPRDGVATLIPLRQSPCPLEYAIGVAHTEPRLHKVIESCLDTLFEDKNRMRAIYAPHFPWLKRSGVLRLQDPLIQKWFPELGRDAEKKNARRASPSEPRS